MMRLRRRPPARRSPLGACRSAACFGGGGKAPPTLLTLTPQARRCRASIARIGARRRGGDDRHPDHRQGTAHDARAGAGRPDRGRLCRGPAVGRHARPTVPGPARRKRCRARPAASCSTRASRRSTPASRVTGQLHRFGYDAAERARSSCATTARWPAAGGTRVETRRFEASVPADGTAATVGPALNHAANQVARKSRAGSAETESEPT